MNAYVASILFSQAAKKSGADDAAMGFSVDSVVEFLSEKGMTLGINLLAAIAIFVIGRWLAGVLTRLAGRMLERSKMDQILIKFLSNLIYALLITFVILAALDRLGVNTTSLAAVVAAAGLAVGLALQGSLSNFAAGVLIIFFKPFGLGDYVEAGGTSGVIEEIQIFSTKMRTGDNRQIIVPNSAITGATITNYSAKPTRRIDLVVGCGYGDDLKAVRQFLEELVAGDERILAEPAPVIAVDALADSSVNFVVRPWVNAADYWPTRWDLNEAIKVGFDERGFSIPYPQQDVHIHQADGEAA